MSAPGEPGPARDSPSARSPDAILLAAGRGVRLGERTRATPKVLLPVGGRPLLDYHLEALRSAGVRRAAIVVHYLAEQIERHVDGGRPFGMELTCVRQPETLGTGDAVRVASESVRSDLFLVCYADVFVKGESSLLRGFLADDTPKIAAARVADGSAFGRLTTTEYDGELRLTGLEEKDGRSVPALVNAGLYLFPRSLLAIVSALSRSVRGEYELTDAVRQFVGRGGILRVVPVDEWVDAGTEESLARADALARRSGN